MERVSGTLIYCRRDGEVLMMHRNKAPNLGLWVAPGGKVEIDESPYECAVRELREETGLEAHSLHFRGLVAETSPREDWQWQLFIYVATAFDGALQADEREGRLCWWPIGEVCARKLSIPDSDAIFFPHIIDLGRPLYQARYVYDENLRLVKVVPHAAE